MSDLGYAFGSLVGAGASTALGLYESRVARRWAERMRGSAYQATMKDMYKAGLNPILAARIGPTATPGVPSSAQIPNFGESLTTGAERGASTRLKGTQNRLAEGEIGLTNAKTQTESSVQETQRTQAELNRVSTARQQAQLKRDEADAEWYSSEEGKLFRKMEMLGNSLGYLPQALMSYFLGRSATNAQNTRGVTPIGPPSGRRGLPAPGGVRFTPFEELKPESSMERKLRRERNDFMRKKTRRRR